MKGMAGMKEVVLAISDAADLTLGRPKLSSRHMCLPWGFPVARKWFRHCGDARLSAATTLIERLGNP
jgi:hypothetical protein